MESSKSERGSLQRPLPQNNQQRIPRSTNTKVNPLLPSSLPKQPLRVRVLRNPVQNESPQLKQSAQVKQAKEQAANPVNQEIVRAAERYKKDIPQVLDAKTKQTRKFVLNEIAPAMVSVFNGVQDASDVLKEVYQQDPGMLEFAAFTDQVLLHAVRTKMITHVCTALGLSPKESALTLIQSLNLPSSIVESLVREILLEDNQRKKEINNGQ